MSLYITFNILKTHAISQTALPRLWLNKYLSILYYKYKIEREEEVGTDLRK